MSIFIGFFQVTLRLFALKTSLVAVPALSLGLIAGLKDVSDLIVRNNG
ncbi:hypothetical protein ABVF61_06475 [Roseibium sp. HPY-6]